MKPSDFLEINPLLSDRTRLAIMATLASAREAVDFSSLLETLEITRGNLSSHMKKLEEAGLVQISKVFLNRKPHTTYSCTEKGRTEIQSYLLKVESFIKMTQKPSL